jgi:hypothetical protein
MGEDRGDPVRDFLGDVAGRDSRRVHGLRCALEVLARGPDGPLFDAFWTRYRVLAPGGQDDTG